MRAVNSLLIWYEKNKGYCKLIEIVEEGLISFSAWSMMCSKFLIVLSRWKKKSGFMNNFSVSCRLMSGSLSYGETSK